MLSCYNVAIYYSMVVTMKFKDSKFEARYSEQWNHYAVAADAMIQSKSGVKRHGIFVLDESRYITLITQYAHASMNIVNNLSRQIELGMYDDMDYATQYLQSTIDSTYADFDTYRNLLRTRYGQHSAGVTFINETLQTLANRFSVYHASSSCSSKVEDDFPASCSY